MTNTLNGKCVEHLCGREFDQGTSNCYQLLRDAYHGHYGIELTDYACPTNWWNTDFNLFNRLASHEGFSLITAPPREWKPADVILMAIGTGIKHPSHCAILLDNGKILHHLYGQLSTATTYGGMFRNTTLAVYRHKDVPQNPPEEVKVDFRSLLPPHVQRRLASLEGKTPAGS